MNNLVKQNNEIDIFSLDKMEMAMKFAEMMCTGVSTIPDHLKGNPADCLAVTIQAMQWNMIPQSVAKETFFIGGSLSYSAKLVTAVVTSLRAIDGRFQYEFSDGWEKLAGKCSIAKVNKKNRKGEPYQTEEPVKGWDEKDESGLWVRVGAIIKGDEKVTWGERVYLSSVLTRNSPLWVTNPAQQISYLASKFWVNLYCPDVLMGVSTDDEPQQATERDITPTAPAEPITEAEKTEAIENQRDPLHQTDLDTLLGAINSADSEKKLSELTDGIEAHLEVYEVDRPQLRAMWKARHNIVSNNVQTA